MSPIPLTVVGGYLGSGKTTLLNEILEQSHGERIAVLVNDFGSINIDAEILGSRDGRTWEIANGCICCDLADGMAAAMASIRAADPPPTRVFVEVSGVGQPEIVARWGDHPGFARDGATVCVDVPGARRNARRKWVGQTVLSQLRSADRLVLTKTDIAEADEIDATRDWLASLPGVDAEIVDRASVLARSTMPVGDQTNGTIDCARSENDHATDGGHSGATPKTAAGGSTEHHAESSGDRVLHSSWTVTTRNPIDPETARRLVAGMPDDIVRVKGILRDSRRPGETFVIQSDGARVSIDRRADHGAADRQISGLDVAAAVGASPAAGRIVVIASGDHSEVLPAVTALAHSMGGRVHN